MRSAEYRRLGKFPVSGVLAGLPWLIAPTSAFAYLDPGSGSILLQMLIGGLASALYTLRLYRQQVKGLLSRLFGGKAPKPARKPGPPASRRPHRHGSSRSHAPKL